MERIVKVENDANDDENGTEESEENDGEENDDNIADLQAKALLILMKRKQLH